MLHHSHSITKFGRKSRVISSSFQIKSLARPSFALLQVQVSGNAGRNGKPNQRGVERPISVPVATKPNGFGLPGPLFGNANELTEGFDGYCIHVVHLTAFASPAAQKTSRHAS